MRERDSGWDYSGQGRSDDEHQYQQQADRDRWQRRAPKNYVRPDERIREDICAHLPHPHYHEAFDVTVEVANGHVTLIGSVPHRGMKHWIEDLAADTPGVNDVDNRLTIPLTAPWPAERKR